MSPPQLIRALGQAAKLCGLADAHGELVALEARATLDDAIGLVEEILDVLDRQHPEPERRTRPVRERLGRPGAKHRDEILALVAEGLSDPEIAKRVGLSRDSVRGLRRRADVAAGDPGNRKRSGWQDIVREVHGRGLTNAEIAAETGWTVRTVQQYMWRLRLSANRRPLEPVLDRQRPEPERRTRPVRERLGRPGAEPVDAEPVDAEPVGAEPVGAEPVGAEPVGAAMARPRPVQQRQQQGRTHHLKGKGGPVNEARDLIEAARIIRRLREAGTELRPDQLELVSWANEHNEGAWHVCGCGSRGHSSHRAAAQHAAWRILSGKGSRQRIFQCRWGGDLLHVGRA